MKEKLDRYREDFMPETEQYSRTKTQEERDELIDKMLVKVDDVAYSVYYLEISGMIKFSKSNYYRKRGDKLIILKRREDRLKYLQNCRATPEYLPNLWNLSLKMDGTKKYWLWGLDTGKGWWTSFLRHHYSVFSTTNHFKHTVWENYLGEEIVIVNTYSSIPMKTISKLANNRIPCKKANCSQKEFKVLIVLAAYSIKTEYYDYTDKEKKYMTELFCEIDLEPYRFKTSQEADLFKKTSFLELSKELLNYGSLDRILKQENNKMEIEKNIQIEEEKGSN